MTRSMIRIVPLSCLISLFLLAGCDTTPPQEQTDQSPATNPASSTPDQSQTAASPTAGTTPESSESGPVLDNPTPPAGLGIDADDWASRKPDGRAYLLKAMLMRRGAIQFKPLGIMDARPDYNLEQRDQMIGFHAVTTQLNAKTDPVTDEAFDELVKHKATLLKLELDGMDLTEEQARRLPELENLEEFFFKLGTFPQSARESLPALSHLKKCTLLYLNLDDSVLASMEFPATLEILDLRLNPKITDASLPTLSALTQLTELSLYGTGITSAGRRELQTALPNCKIQPSP